MALHRFQDVPGRLGMPGQQVNTLVNIRQLVQPPATGPHRQLLDSLGYPFEGFDDAAFRATRLSRAYLALRSSGLLDVLDFIAVRSGLLSGLMVNLVPDGTSATNNGATEEAYGLLTDGTSTYVDLAFGANASNYTLDNACHFAVAEVAGAQNSPLIGRITSTPDAVRLYPRVSSGQAQARINSAVNLQGPNGGVFTGIWLAQRTSSTDVALYRNNSLIAASDDNASTSLPPSMALGRNSTGYGAWGASCFGYGASLNGDQRAALYTIISEYLAIT